MTLVNIGSGPPVLVVPGIQGRWEWMRPGIEALARQCQVVTGSLCDEPTSGGRFDEADGFGNYVRHCTEMLDRAGLQRATVCGVSYGGLVAAAYAASHPERVSGLVLVSAVPPTWTPDARVRFYLRAPRLLSPVFMAASLRLYKEIAAAHETFGAGVRAAVRHGVNALRHPFSPLRMARRVRLLEALQLTAALRGVDVETLVVTGEDALERVVPPRLTREYNRLWPHAAQATISSTGHLGVITRPDEFARIVGGFASRAAAADGQRRRIG